MAPVDGRPVSPPSTALHAVDTDNGSAVNGHTNEPLIDGNATLVGYRNGTVNIIKWTGGPNAATNAPGRARHPILWDGKLNPSERRPEQHPVG